MTGCFCLLLCAPCGFTLPRHYKGKPFTNKFHKTGAQVIPGVAESALYDLGGEGVAYHDVDASNNGAKLNHTEFMRGAKNGLGGILTKHCLPGVSDYIYYFRENEGVDISYTKAFADYSHLNLVDPPKEQLYIGWEEDGEWTNYTVNVLTAGTYKILALYGNEANTLKFDIDGHPAADAKIPIATGKMHIWNKAAIGTITFPRTGLHLLTLHYDKGNNLASFEFVLVKKN
jgi:hypothetical protein